MTALGMVAAVLAAAGFAAAAVLQHAAVAGRGVQLRLLVTDRRWLAGLGCLAAATALHVVALAVAPLSVVQPLGVLAVVFATGFAVCAAHRAPRPAELAAVAMTVAGVGGFVLCTAGAAHTGTHVAAAPLVVGALVAAGAVVGWRGRAAVRCVGFACAGAAGYALVSVLTRVAAVRIEADGLTAAAVLAVLGGAVSALVGGWLIQHAYRAGAPDLVLACQTVGDPAVAVGIGLALLGEAATLPAAAVPALAGCALLAACGVTVLARDRARHHVNQLSTSDTKQDTEKETEMKAGTPHDTVPA